MNTNINNNGTPTSTNLDVLRPLEFTPKPVSYKGTFVSKTWDTEAKSGKPCRDLVVKVALEEKNELEQPFVVERRYNMLPRGRGVSDFKKDMAGYLGYRVDKTMDEFPPKLLANQSLIVLDGKPVTITYKKNEKRGFIEFDSFKPIEETAQPTAAATA